MSVLDELRDEPGADRTGRPRDEDSHRALSSIRRSDHCYDASRRASVTDGRTLWGAMVLVGIWSQYAPDVRGQALPTGHFVSEEAPGLVVDVLKDFLD